jgi:MFS family permease
MTDQAIKSADDHFDIQDVERRVKAIFIGSVGNLVEWYDFYAYTAFALYFAPAFFPNSDPVVQQLNAAVLFAATFLMRPLGGWLFGFIADRYGRRLSLTLSVICMCFGRKPLLIFFGVMGTLATVPILTTLKDTKSPFTAFLLICAAWIFVAGYTSINAVVKAELFPTNVRALGVGLPYAITVSLFGGTAPAVALYFKTLGHEDWFYYYLSGMIFLSLIIYATMRDTKHASAMHRHE